MLIAIRIGLKHNGPVLLRLPPEPLSTQDTVRWEAAGVFDLFHNKLAYNSAGTTIQNVDFFTPDLSQSGARRAVLEVHRSFEQDPGENRKWLHEHSNANVPSLVKKDAKNSSTQLADTLDAEVTKETEHWVLVVDSAFYKRRAKSMGEQCSNVITLMHMVFDYKASRLYLN